MKFEKKHFEKKQIHKLDLLSLPADEVLNAISNKISGELEDTLFIGKIIIKKIGTLALDQENDRIILSGENDKKQGLLLSFGVHDNPVIKPTVTVLGAEKNHKIHTIKKD